MAATVPVITFDGPGGSGKGTIGLRVAAALGWHYLDSGALYRLVAQAATDGDVPLDDVERLAVLATGLDVVFSQSGVTLAGVDVTEAIRTEKCGNAASQVAALPAVRAALLERQHRFLNPPGLIADGRDMGSVVFPAARPKFFITANLAERAKRRYKQLKQKGIGVSLDSVFEELTERDARDTARSASPLKAAQDAVVIDTSEMDPDAVFARAMHIINQLVPVTDTGY